MGAFPRLSYEITDPDKLDAKFWKNTATQLTVATAFGAGLPWLGSLMSSEGRGNFKVVFNSPNTLNPTQVKVVQVIPSERGAELLGSLADSTGGSILSHAGGEMLTPAGKRISIPVQASMTVKQANAWQVAVGTTLKTLVNAKATLREQAAQAVRIANDVMLAARNAMEDANAAALLAMTNPIRSLNEWMQSLGKEYSGDALYKKIIDKVQDSLCKFRTVMNRGGCFAAGTLVHTKEGLKPIEQIKVGDWVLSQPEDRGELAYKRVKNTFCFEDKSVVLVDFVLQRNGEWIVGDRFVVTGNHPFWVEGVERSWFPEELIWDASDENRGWTRADLLCYGDIVCLASGERAVITSPCSVEKLWRTKKENVAWMAKAGDEDGHFVTIEGGANATIDSDSVLNDFFYEDDTFRYRDEKPEWEEAWYYRCKVYNFEVEDFHTYYVGNFGVWVHNTGSVMRCSTQNF